MFAATVMILISQAVFSQEKAAVDYRANETRLVNIGDSSVVKLIGDVYLYHNGAIIACDTAYRYSERRFEAFSNVIINQDSLYIYGDKVIYNGETDIAKVLSQLIKVVDGGDMVMYTKEMFFNTKSQIGYFNKGLTVSDGESLMESYSGTYNTQTKVVTLDENVSMENEEYIMKSDSLIYDQMAEQANFKSLTNIWNKKGEYLQADKGRYDKLNNIYYFDKNSYILTEDQECWADSITYFRGVNEIELKRDIQLDDTTQMVSAYGDYAYMWSERKSFVITKRPSIFTYEETAVDTSFVSADTILVNPIIPRLIKTDTINIKPAGVLDSLVNLEKVQKLAEKLTTLIKENDLKDIDLSKLSLDGIDLGSLDKDVIERELISLSPNIIDSMSNILLSEELINKGKGIINSIIKGDTEELEVAVGKVKEGVSKLDFKKFEDMTGFEDKIDSMEVKNLIDTLKNSSSTIDRIEDKLDEELLKYNEEKEVIDSVEVAIDSIAQVKLPTYRALYTQDSLSKMDAKTKRKALKEMKNDERRFNREIKRYFEDLSYLKKLTHEKEVQDSIIQAMLPPKDSVVDAMPVIEEIKNIADSNDIIVRAYLNAKVYQNDMQSIADTMILETVDSTTTSIGNPIAWNGTNQIVAKRIRSYVKDGNLYRTRMFSNPVMVQHVYKDMYNQIRGDYMDALYTNNVISRLIVNKKAKGRFYREELVADSTNLVDIVAFITSESENMIIDMNDNTITKIKWVGKTKTTTFPMELIDSKLLYLDEFVWTPEHRPTKRDVFDRNIRPSERREMEALSKPSFSITKEIMQTRARLIKEGVWTDRNDKLKINREELIRQAQTKNTDF